MPLDLPNTLVVGISTTALFDMSESDQIFRDALKNDPDQAIELFRSVSVTPTTPCGVAGAQ